MFYILNFLSDTNKSEYNKLLEVKLKNNQIINLSVK